MDGIFIIQYFQLVKDKIELFLREKIFYFIGLRIVSIPVLGPGTVFREEITITIIIRDHFQSLVGIL